MSEVQDSARSLAAGAVLTRLQGMLDGWPEVSERPCYGTPAFYVAGRIFARQHELPGVIVLWCASQEARQILLDSEPAAFFITDHYRKSSSVLVRMDQVPDDELEELLREAWFHRAPKKLRDREPGTTP